MKEQKTGKNKGRTAEFDPHLRHNKDIQDALGLYLYAIMSHTGVTDRKKRDLSEQINVMGDYIQQALDPKSDRSEEDERVDQSLIDYNGFFGLTNIDQKELFPAVAALWLAMRKYELDVDRAYLLAIKYQIGQATQGFKDGSVDFHDVFLRADGSVLARIIRREEKRRLRKSKVTFDIGIILSIVDPDDKHQA